MSKPKLQYIKSVLDGLEAEGLEQKTGYFGAEKEQGSETTAAQKKTSSSAKKQFPWPTVGGYDFYEVLSALQKAVRRGDEKKALYWSHELYLSDYAPHLWTRLRVMASEDVGLADSSVAILVRALF